MIQKRLLHTFLMLLLAVFVASCAQLMGQPREEVSLSASSADFLRNSAAGHYMEIQSAQMVRERSSNQSVREFAAQLNQDHSDMLSELEEVAATRGVQLPEGVTPPQRNILSQLEQLPPEKLDWAYTDAVIRAHEGEIQRYSEYIRKAESEALRNLAQEAMPILEEHLQMAQELRVELLQQ